MVRAMDARSARAHVRRTRLPFTFDSFRVCRASSDDGNRAVFGGEDPWLCVPASRRVCPGHLTGGGAIAPRPRRWPVRHPADMGRGYWSVTTREGVAPSHRGRRAG